MTCPHCHAPNADDARFCGVCGRSAAATQPESHPDLGEAPALIGREIAGRYRMLAKLGEGGMGAVYKAEQLSLKRTVAVKLLRPEVASSQLLLRRFNAEAEAVAKLSHPNTVNIYDFGQDTDGTLFIAMEYIEGQSLRSVVHREAPLPVQRALAIALQISASLTDAHARSIVHRDLKPDNVMLQERGRQRDIVRVLDFGIAKLRDENRQSYLAMTQAGDVLGTPQYMAPEQIRAEKIDGRTDVYALGCMVYEMVTGRLPYEGPTVMSLLSKHLLEHAVPPSQRRPELMLSPAIDELILTAMAKDPASRPATMEIYGEQIAAMLAMMPVDTQQRSAAHPLPGPRPEAAVIQTPPAYSAAAGHAPTAAPGHAQAAVAGPVPPVAGHGPLIPFGHPGAPASTPHRATPDGAAPTPSPSAGSSKALWILLALCVLAGAGTGVCVALDRSVPAADPWAGPGSGSTTVVTSGSSDLPPVAVADAADPWNTSVAAAPPDEAAAAVDEPVDPSEPPPTISTAGISRDCAAFVRAIEKLATCNKLPEVSRAQMKQSAQQAATAYGAPTMKLLTPEQRAQMEATCAQGAAGMTQALATYGCK